MDKETNIVKQENKLAINSFEMLDKALTLAKVVAKSKVFNQAGNEDEVVAAILLGTEMGFTPMQAVSLGKRLTPDKVHSVLKGQSLGIHPIVALEHIHQIKTSNGYVSTVGIHLAMALVLKAGIKINIIEDFIPLTQYVGLDGEVYPQEIVEANIDKFQVITQATDKADYDSDKIQIAFTTNIYGRRTKVQMKRDDQVVTINYTTQQAIDAGLLGGINSKGETIKGKANWNENPATMLRNRTLIITARLIAADVINGIYTFDEVAEFTDAKVSPDGTILYDAAGNQIATDTDEDVVLTGDDPEVEMSDSE